MSHPLTARRLIILNAAIPAFELNPEWFLKGHETQQMKEGMHVLVNSLNHEANLTAL